ncbi:MipA/OmpV family protein [Pseudoduganella sp. OTU4001]|uniref:MipA/OmpV family protein n=1 Tax=Pseudoduganella sp. OTU4001 TaxID=3043854 RepID=UPI00313DCC32
MRQYLFLALAGACSTVAAQTPATNPMPDGSRDMFIGVGAQSVPRYEGADDNRTLPLPVMQIQWSNGIFVSGTSVGWHLSPSPSMEFGPLLAMSPRRDRDGLSLGIGSVGESSDGRAFITGIRPGGIVPGGSEAPAENGGNKLYYMDVVKRRVLYGGFFNYYLSPKLRLTNNLTYGGGKDRNGARLHTALQYMLEDIVPHHTVVLSAGVSVVNRANNETWFGITKDEASRSTLSFYRPDGGVQSVRASLRWNWALSPSWMLTSGLQVDRLAGDAKRSPLVDRATNVYISSALAYRF